MKYLLTFLLLLIGIEAKAVITTNTPLTLTTNMADVQARTNEPFLLKTIVYDTNLTTVNTPLVVGGSTLPNVNGTYTMAYTNVGGGYAGGDLVVWTNLTATWIIAARDPGQGSFYPAAIEEELGGEVQYVGSISAANLPFGFEADFGPPDTITITYATNEVRTPHLESTIANGYFYRDGNTNIIVDPLNGNDAAARFSRGTKTAFRTFSEASKYATNVNDVVEVVPGIYDLTFTESSTFWAPGITFLGNGSIISGSFFFYDNTRVRNLHMRGSGTHFNNTNSAASAVTNTIFVTDSTFNGLVDGTDTTENRGTIWFRNCTMGSFYDGVIITGQRSNGVFRLDHCNIIVQGTNGIANPNGNHGIGWYQDNTGGGTLEINGGSIYCLNPTNATFSGTVGAGNAAIMIDYNSGQSTHVNANLRLHGVAIGAGSTNGSVWATLISNKTTVQISGNYQSNLLGAQFYSPFVRSKWVNIDK